MKPPYLVEKKLPLHIKQYMESHPRIDAGELTDHLMKNYREYRKKNRVPFLKTVVKAYKYQLFKKGADLSKVSMFFSDEDYKLNNIKPETVKANGSEESAEPPRKKAKIEQSKVSLFSDRERLYTLEKAELSPELWSLPEFPTFREIYHKFMVIKKLHHILSGPPQNGKTTIVRSIAQNLQSYFLKTTVIKCIVSMGTDDAIEYLFKLAESKQPCIFLIEFGSLFGKDDENRKTYQLSAICDKIVECMEEMHSRLSDVKVVIEIHDASILSDGFRQNFIESFVPPLTQEGRLIVLKKFCAKHECAEETLEVVAQNTPGYVVVDLKEIVMDVCLTCHKEISKAEGRKRLEKLKNKENSFSLRLETFMKCIQEYKPTLMLEGFPTVPETSIDDVGGMDDVKKILQTKIFTNMKRFSQNADAKCGILLWGPPGCGKTMLARAIANETNINFIAISSSDLLDKYQGETEKNIKAVFERAANVAPTIVFFDELDAICPRRSKHSQGGSKMTIVTSLLHQMEGIYDRKGVYVMATTNRPDLLDPAVLRPGRFDTIVYVGLPTHGERMKIFETILKNDRIADDVVMKELADKTEGFSPADCLNLCRRTARNFCQAYIANNKRSNNGTSLTGAEAYNNIDTEFGSELAGRTLLYREHFASALNHVFPSVSAEQMNEVYKIGRKLNSRNWPPPEMEEQKASLIPQKLDSDDMDVCIF